MAMQRSRRNSVIAATGLGVLVATVCGCSSDRPITDAEKPYLDGPVLTSAASDGTGDGYAAVVSGHCN